MTDSDEKDGLVTLTTTSTEFEAHAVLAVLKEEGIDAFAFGSVQSAFPLQARLLRVPVQVRRRDFERAQAALRQNVPDSIDIDWDTAEDSAYHATQPIIVRIGFAVGLLALLIMAIAAVLVILSLF